MGSRGVQSSEHIVRITLLNFLQLVLGCVIKTLRITIRVFIHVKVCASKEDLKRCDLEDTWNNLF